jgi:hypothetical protein
MLLSVKVISLGIAWKIFEEGTCLKEGYSQIIDQTLAAS